MSNRVDTITNDKMLAGLVNTVFTQSVLFTRIGTAAKKWPSSSQLKKTLNVSKNLNGGSFDGYDPFSITPSDTRITIAFDPKYYHQDLSISYTEVTENENDKSNVIDLVKAELETAAGSMVDGLGTLVYGTGTGKDMLGLEAIVDDGTNAATYGGKTRSSYDSLDATVTASGGKLTLAKLATLNDTVSDGAIESTAIYTTKAIFSLYEQLLSPQERIQKDVSFIKGMSGGTGFTALAYRGIPMLKDSKCTSGVLYMLNENFLDFHASPLAMTKPINFSVSMEGIDPTAQPKGLGFTWSGWKEAINGASAAASIYFGGALYSSRPNAQGKLTGINSI